MALPIPAVLFAAAMLVHGAVLAQNHGGEMLEATTVGGDKVRLLPNGRWEFVDARKAEAARSVAQRYPENQGCPNGTQGGLFGVGRCIQPGDKDYNRGTLNPAKR